MNSTWKKRLLIGAILLLLLINITALITIIYNSSIREKKMEAAEIKNQQAQINGMHGFFRNELQLTDDQFEEFQMINNTAISNSRDIAFKLHNNRIILLEEVAKLNPDLNKLDSIAQQIGRLHYELKNNTITQFIELKKLCTNDQQQILQEMFNKMILEQDNERARMKGMREQNRSRNRKGRPRHPKRN